VKPYQEYRTRQGHPIALFGVEETEDGGVLALGSHAPESLRRGRVLISPTGTPYRLAAPLPAGLRLVGGPQGHDTEELVILEAKEKQA
jgi:hypothetical protein